MTETQINSKKKTKDFFSFLVFLLVLCLTFYVISQLFIPSVKEDCIYTVERGTSFKQISRSLEDEGLIPSGLSLETYAQLMGKDSQIKAGSFALKKGQSPVQILNSLVYDKPVLARVTIPEGFTADQVKTRVQRDLPSVEPLLDIIKQSKLPEPIKAEFLASPPPSPEGYLFPDTYYYSKTKPEEIYNAMYHQLVLTLEDLFLDYPDNPITNGTLTLHQAIILASVVEKEALLDEERSVIAGVFLKRLKGGMYLQSCATVTYLLDKPITRLTYKDLEVDSPYNTYLYPGLPYGPIGNPGRQSLEAVFNPKVTEYLFFVAKGDGSHVFTRTYQEHLNAQLIHEDWLKQNSKE